MKNLARTDLAKAIVFDRLFNSIVDESGEILGDPSQFDKIDYSAGIVNNRGEATITVKLLKIKGVLYEFYGKYDCGLNRVFFKSCMITRPFKASMFVSCFNLKLNCLWDSEEEDAAAGVQDTDSLEEVSGCDNFKTSSL